MIGDLLVGVAASTLVGIALWLLLPRGVVLTRQMRTTDWRGEPLYDTWVLRNDSAVAARLLRVQVTSSTMYDDARGLLASLRYRRTRNGRCCAACERGGPRSHIDRHGPFFRRS